MPYEHDAPAAPPEPPATARWEAPAPLRWSPAGVVVSLVLTLPAVLTGVWREPGSLIWALVIVVVSHPLGWLLWTRWRT